MASTLPQSAETATALLDAALVEAITQFTFDDEARDRSFARRLARDNSWTMDYTERVITEYRRFVVLAVGSGHPVTPSDQVDQAWHLHLTFTRSYWEDLCLGVLGRPLHHNPTKGGPQEREKFRGWYAKTLESYVRVFDAAPPKDIWPDVETRFDRKANVTRIDRNRNWLIPKPRYLRIPTGRRESVIFAVVLAVLSAAFAVIRTGAPIPGDFTGRTIQLSSAEAGMTVFVAAFSILIAVGFFLTDRCPQCNRRNSQFRTGATRHGRWKRVQEEWTCRQCGRLFWRARRAPPSRNNDGCDAGCDGCGGCE